MENDKGKGTKETECQGHAGHCSMGSSSTPITPAAATALSEGEDFFFFCFIISAFDLCRSWQQSTKPLFPATTDPPKVTVELWLPQPLIPSEGEDVIEL